MALNGARLLAALSADILVQLQAKFPKPPGLQTAESASFDTQQANLALAFASAIGPDTVTEITGFAVVPGITAGGAATTVT